MNMKYFRVQLIFQKHCCENLFFCNLMLKEKHVAQQNFLAYRTIYFAVTENKCIV